MAIVGIDGSGKTTLAIQLTKRLSNQGIKAQYAYSRYKPLLTRPFSRWFDATVLGDSRKDAKAVITKLNRIKGSLINQSGLLHLVYLIVLLFDYSIFLMLHVRKSTRNTLLICDRYIQDTLVNEVFFHPAYLSRYFLVATARSWIKLMPMPDLTLYVDVPEKIAFERKKDIPSIEFIREKKTLYRAIHNTILAAEPKYNQVFELDGEQKAQDIADAAYAEIVLLLGRKPMQALSQKGEGL